MAATAVRSFEVYAGEKFEVLAVPVGRPGLPYAGSFICETMVQALFGINEISARNVGSSAGTAVMPFFNAAATTGETLGVFFSPCRWTREIASVRRGAISPSYLRAPHFMPMLSREFHQMMMRSHGTTSSHAWCSLGASFRFALLWRWRVPSPLSFHTSCGAFGPYDILRENNDLFPYLRNSTTPWRQLVEAGLEIRNPCCSVPQPRIGVIYPGSSFSRVSLPVSEPFSSLPGSSMVEPSVHFLPSFWVFVLW